MQLKHGKAVASRNVGSTAAWTLPQEVFTMETKRFLIPVVGTLVTATLVGAMAAAAAAGNLKLT